MTGLNEYFIVRMSSNQIFKYFLYTCEIIAKGAQSKVTNVVFMQRVVLIVLSLQKYQVLFNYRNIQVNSITGDLSAQLRALTCSTEIKQIV